MKNKVLIINHVFWPDQHNTARHISELSYELVKRGWDVTALICNRSYVNYKKTFEPKSGIINGVKYLRVYTPPLNQKKNFQRLFTSFWLITAWILKLPFIGKYDAIIIGTNPPFVYLISPFLKLFKPEAKLFLWGFDLYPEAIIAAGNVFWKLMGSIIKPIARWCYKKFDVIVDIGPCMRNRYLSYGHKAKMVTLTPWSFVEPSSISTPHDKMRKELFDNANLAMLYSGTIGNAHEFDNFLLLARELRKKNASVGFCFAGFGNRFDQLKKQVTVDDTNISFGGFVKTDKELEQRLSSADIMLISLKREWTGISVPSKYFAALANGKAVLFSGSENSALSIWTKEYNLGYHLTKDNIKQIANNLMDISKDVSKIEEKKQHAFDVYYKRFSKEVVCNGWSELLKETINN